MKKQVLLFVLMLMPLMASAQIENKEINGIYYYLNSTDKVAAVECFWDYDVVDGTYPVPSYRGEIVIPKTVVYEGVTYSVTSIGGYAFSGCTGLTSVTIPNSVTSIGGDAFYGCSGLTSITIPNSVTSIDYYAFYGCSGLTSITVVNGNTMYDSRNNCNAIIKTSTNELIAGCKSTIIPNSVSSIGDWAFSYCSSLISVTIPTSVTSIGSYAFSDCSGLTSVTIPNSVTSIGSFAFSGCSGLTSLFIGDGVTSIGSYAFSGCSGLTSVTIPNSVTTLEYHAFSGCSGLTSLFIGDGVTSIGSNNNLSNLKSLTIGNGVTTISNNAFQGCSKLSSVSIGKGIKSVGTKAFANCPEIKEVYCYAKDVPTISNDTFENSYYIKWATLYVPESSVDLYKASAWSQFGNIVGITGGNEGERCEKPVITLLANGKIKVESATEGATCVTNITASNAEPLSDGEISLNTPLTVYTITSYATKEGYDDSEVTTATFRYEKAEGDMNGDGMLNITDVIHLVNMILGQ